MTLIDLRRIINQTLEGQVDSTPVNISIADQGDRRYIVQVTEVYFDPFRNALVIVPEE